MYHVSALRFPCQIVICYMITKTSKNITVHVIPNSRHQEIIVEEDGFLKIKLTSSPTRGKANQELIKLLSKKYKVSKSQVEIVKGLTSKQKLVQINL